MKIIIFFFGDINQRFIRKRSWSNWPIIHPWTW